jgi:hypothetical protein
LQVERRLPDFITKFENENYSRRAVVLSCLHYLESIDIDTSKARLSPCGHTENLYFGYNQICKVYFTYNPDTQGMILLDFIFANHDF